MRHFLEKCPCGSGESAESLLDARGIFCSYICTKCEATQQAKYRADIFVNSQYECDEQVEPDDGGYYDDF